MGDYAGIGLRKGLRGNGLKIAMLFKAFDPNQPRFPMGHPKAGQWRSIVVLTGDEIGDANNPHQLQRDAREYLRTNLEGKIFRNDHLQHDVLIDNTGIEKLTRREPYIKRLQAIAGIPEMIKSGVWIRSEPDYRDRKQVKAVHRFHSIVEIGADRYDAFPVIREMLNGNNYYDHNLTHIGKAKQRGTKKGVEQAAGLLSGMSHGATRRTPCTAYPYSSIPKKSPFHSGKVAFVFKSVKSGLKPGDPHPTMPHLAPSDAAMRSIVKERGHDPVPPASWGLHVSPDPDAKVQATWHDAKGRPQYRYHKDHTRLASDHKYKALASFHAALPHIRAKVQEDLHKPDASPDRVKAAVVHLMDHTAIRVGSEKYAHENGTFGASSLRKQHVEVAHDGGQSHEVKVHFTGKHGKEAAKEVHDAPFHAAVSHLMEQPGERVFQQRTKAGDLAPVTEKHVNDYLKPFGVHAHQFRTYHGTRIAATHLLSQPHTDDPKIRAKHVRDAMVKVSSHLGNTPEQAKSSYVSPEVVHHYMAGTLRPEHAMEVQG